MKSFTKLLALLLSTILLPIAMWANVIVKGRVTYLNGTPAANYAVYILSDSLPGNTCSNFHTRYTNANGVYQDTLVCTAAIPNVTVYIRDCNNLNIVHNLPVTASGIVESNFTVCQNNQCHADFTWQANGLSAKFYSGTSSPGNSTAAVIKRTWTFGDGTVENGNVVDPTHTYASPGTYNVCLKIKTSDSCENTVCRSVVISGPVQCLAAFISEAVPTNKIRFNSAPTSIVAGDSIISRKWIFGDGDSLTGNIFNPLHQYPSAGTYNVCLIIKTKLGCESRTCRTIQVGAPVGCHALFTFVTVPSNTPTAQTIHFNGWVSTTAPGDSLYRFLWNFGDGTSGTTGDPNHMYTQAGTYNVCLRITSYSGCVDSICKTVVVPPLQCEPRFTFTSTALVYHFNSATSSAAAGDSIIARLWTFGDGLSATTIDPVHAYAQAGRYLVCLRITTRLGCIKTKCDSISVVNPVGSCVAHFTAQMPAPKIAVFNSNSSSVSQAGDSIVSRKWSFGDGQSLITGNTISPTHQYTFGGTYNVCLSIKTRLGCESRWCTNIHVTGDSTYGDPIRIVSIYPNPVYSPLNVVVWSRNANIPATLAIYDVYGIIKYSVTTTLPIGNSTHQLPTATLAPGPYVFKLTTMFGTQNRNFFKL